MVSTHNTSKLTQPLEIDLCESTPISMSDSDIGSLNQFPNPKGDQSITEPTSVPKGKHVLNQKEEIKFSRIADAISKPLILITEEVDIFCDMGLINFHRLISIIIT